MPEKNPLTGKKTRTSANKPPASSAPRSGGLSPVSSQIGNFSDTIALPYAVPAHDPNSLIPGNIYNPSTALLN